MRRLPQNSPLEPIVADFGKALPLAFQEQFLHSDKMEYGMQLRGVLHKIWFRPRALAPLFWFLGKCRILIPSAAQEAPTTLDVITSRDTSGLPVHTWSRTVAIRNRRIEFPTSIIYDAKLHRVVDLVGPCNVIYMVWRAAFHDDGSFTLDSEANAFRVGRLKLWLPRWLWPWLLGTVTFVQKAHPDAPDTISIDLLLTHPLFGKVFGYDGTFRAVRVPKARI